jgi:ATP-dependent DNA helicase RecG
LSQSNAESPGTLRAGLAALRRPLAFAARDDFAHVGRLQNLGAAVQAACQQLEKLSIPEDFRRFFRELAAAFSKGDEGEEEAGEGDRAALRELITRALSELEPFDGDGWRDALLARPTSVLSGVGPKRAESLGRRGLRNIGDLLFHLPAGYEDRRALVKVGDLEVGRRATFLAEVLLVDFVSTRSGGRFRQLLQCVVGDGGGTLNLKWFRGGDSIAKKVHKGDWLLITGDVKRYRFSKEIIHPEIERVEGASGAPDEGESALRQVVPRYLAPEGVNARTLRRLIEHAVAEYADTVEGHLPEALIRERGLPGMADALRTLHKPPADADVDAYAAAASPAHQRLVLEELFLLEVGLGLRRQAGAALPGIPVDVTDERVRAAPASLPFTLTGAQQRAWSEICADLARPHPMHRLLQGDVGSGKTAVALLAAVAAASGGGQAALMAPTELLAEQHARTLRHLVGTADSPLHLRVGLLTASRPAAELAEVKRALAAGELDLVVGTHALVQEDVRFARLTLAIVDEQHRFGVRQRAALARAGDDGRHPHILVMTATPIPRTLAMTVYGDLDLSVIDERPPGRTPVQTLLLREGEGVRITALVREALGRGEQVYVVYPLVEESEKVDLRSAIESTERIRAAFPEVVVDLVHGRLDAEERGAVMARFAAGESRILVSTTVIEVGVDVHAATLMIIEHAERFGLAQLHQLRGRVGRGEAAGTCVLVARGGSEKGEARLRAMLETDDGFAIADADLQIRGPGEFLGTRQSGHLPDLRVADLVRDARLVSVAREAALAHVRSDPGLARSPELARAVKARWGDRLALVDIG